MNEGECAPVTLTATAPVSWIRSAMLTALGPLHCRSCSPPETSKTKYIQNRHVTKNANQIIGIGLQRLLSNDIQTLYNPLPFRLVFFYFYCISYIAYVGHSRGNVYVL
jgi:hypothetical protein